jgi:hypothetical protein
MRLDHSPNLPGQRDDSDPSPIHILLMGERPVCRDENFEASVLCRLHKLSVFQTIETRKGYRNNLVLWKMQSQLVREVFIQKNPHS